MPERNAARLGRAGRAHALAARRLLHDAAERRGSAGTPRLAEPIAGELLIRNEDGAALPPGEVGELFMRKAGGGTPSYRYVAAEAIAIGLPDGDLGVRLLAAPAGQGRARIASWLPAVTMSRCGAAAG